eukprot:jgi/Ulvmu1/2991/UM015_0031.1
MSDSESSDDLPLAQRAPNGARRVAPPPGAMKDADGESGEDDVSEVDDSGSDAVPPKAKSKTKQPARPAAKRKPERASASEGNGRKAKVQKSPSRKSAGKDDKGAAKWATLEHGGVLFPPEYVPHGVKLKYDGVPVDLTPEQEEVATMYATMLDTDYVKEKPTFINNFWQDFKAILGPKHKIKTLDKCDFRDIYDHVMKEREAKKAMTKEEKAKLKAEKEAAEARYKFALIDSRKEPVGNFRVEPPGLFRGRGEHPKMGKLKARIYPRDITINIGHGVKPPDHPYEGQQWKEVRHDKSVTWLAFWKDPIDPKGYKYVWLGANSTFKTEADLAKYEKARKLKDHIERIRKDYRRLWSSADVKERQKSTALYFIDVLALRAGHEKDEDEADTVGCCTLKADNVQLLSEKGMDEDGVCKIKLDFLGKDSIRYENVVEVEPAVYKNMKTFKAKNADSTKKKAEEQLFDAMDAGDLNAMMKDYMDGLSVKVFRTYNASVTLDRLLWEPSQSQGLPAMAGDYHRANKEVAILCNHQRAVPKGHAKSMETMQEKHDTATKALKDAQSDLKRVLAGKDPENGKKRSADALKADIERKKKALDTLNEKMKSKEELKDVALGTSKINYLDPRITVAWCKRMDMPLEKIFNQTLRGKFSWAMEVEPEFRF